MSEVSPDKTPLEAFLEQYWKDREAEHVRSLDEYIAQFPGDAAGIAREYFVLESTLTDAIPAAGSTLAHYRLIEELGRGGFGVVWRAEDTRLGREVAVKILKHLGSASGEVFERFKREAAIAANLKHPSLCAVFDVGRDGATPYIVMELLDGETIRDKITTAKETTSGRSSTVMLDSTDLKGGEVKGAAPEATGTVPEGRTAVARILETFEAAARALHVAHESGVIHRDIKPANIMVVSDGRPVIMDFGLARSEDMDLDTLTQSGDFFGTPEYMSPEQLTRQTIKLDRRTDVWSLGVTLYESLTLHRPFQSPTRQALYKAITGQDVPDPRRVNRSISRDLKVVLETAMEKSLFHRYQTAEDLAEELRRVREHEPIKARPASVWLRVQRWVQRNPARAAAMLSLLLGVVVSTYFAIQASSRLQEWERLAEGRRLDDLITRSDLWPATSRTADDMLTWLHDARVLASRLDEHRAALTSLRETSLPYSDQARAKDRVTHASQIARLDVIATGRKKLSQLPSQRADLERRRDEMEDSDDAKVRRKARRIEKDLDALDAKLTALEKESVSWDAEEGPLRREIARQLTWEFVDDGDQWRHDKLRDLVTGLERLVGEPSADGVTIREMVERHELASTLRQRSIEAHLAAWDRCSADVSRAHSRYGGLRVPPQEGLVPLGVDRDSGLWEFWHVASGASPVPAWDGDAHWSSNNDGDPRGQLDSGKLTPEMGMVLVLIPGWTFSMGAQADDESEAGDDPEALSSEKPVHDVTLSPFFISKYEMTQAHWMRWTKENPSFHQPGMDLQVKVTLMHPVDQVNWVESTAILRRCDLLLPTEAQWEYACRSGSRTVYANGNLPSDLEDGANIMDEGSWKETQRGYEPGYSDGFRYGAPVGSRSANHWGLHDMPGNLYEWCQDRFQSYQNPTRAGDGLRPGRAGTRVVRGGSWGHAALYARSSARSSYPAGFHGSTVGVRPARRVELPER